MKKSFWKGLAMYALGLGLLAWVVYRYWDPPEGHGLREALSEPVGWLPLTLAAVFTATAATLTFVRWWLLVRAQGLHFGLTDGLRLGMVGYYFNTFLPGSVGGDIVKAVAIAREQSRRTVAVSTVLFDRAIGLWGLVWMVAICGAVFWAIDEPHLQDNAILRTIVHSAWGVIAVTLGGWLLLGLLSDRQAHRIAGRIGLIPKAGHILAECWRAVWLYRRRTGAVAIALILALGTWAAAVLGFHYAAHSFVSAADAADLPTLTEHALIVPVGMLVQAVPLAPGGVGVGETYFLEMYKELGRPPALGVRACLILRAMTWVLGFIGYVFYLRMKPTAPIPEAAEPATVGSE